MDKKFPLLYILLSKTKNKIFPLLQSTGQSWAESEGGGRSFVQPLTRCVTKRLDVGRTLEYCLTTFGFLA